MDKIRKRLGKLADKELRTVSKAINCELKRRLIQSGGMEEEDMSAALPIHLPMQRMPRLRRAA